MSASRTIASYSLKNLHLLAHRTPKVYALNPYHSLQISTSKYRHSFITNEGFSLNICHRIHSTSFTKMDATVHSNSQPSAPVPPGPPSSSRVKWILGALLSIIAPFGMDKWASLLELEREVDAAVDIIDTAVEVVEVVAEEAEKVADEVADKAQDGGKLKDAANFVENVAKNVANDAHATDELVHKVEKVEKEVKKITETVLEQENVGTKEVGKEK